MPLPGSGLTEEAADPYADLALDVDQLTFGDRCARDAQRDELPDRAAWIGDVAQRALGEALASAPGPWSVRGEGLMIGVHVGGAATALALQRALLASGWIVTLGGVRSDVLVLTPPLVISSSLLEAFVETLRDLLASSAMPRNDLAARI